jgi:hypothetical protein
MIIKTIVPKLGDSMQYVGKPVKDDKGIRIGSITEVNDVGDCYELIMDIPAIHSGSELLNMIKEGLSVKNE